MYKQNPSPEAMRWGEVRGLIHDPGLGLIERATALDEAMRHLGPSEALSRYLEDHLPSWFEHPYELVRAWMRGRLLYLLWVMGADEDLVRLLSERARGWPSVYDSYCDRRKGRYGAFFEHGPLGDHALAVTKRHLVSLAPQHTSAGLITYAPLELELEDKSVVSYVELDLELRALRLEPEPTNPMEFVALARFFDQLGTGRPEAFLCDPFHESAREARFVEMMWGAYKRLCQAQRG